MNDLSAWAHKVNQQVEVGDAEERRKRHSCGCLKSVGHRLVSHFDRETIVEPDAWDAIAVCLACGEDIDL